MHEPWEEQEAQQKRKAVKAEQIAANAWNNKGAGRGAGRGGRYGKGGRDGRGKGGGGKDGGGRETEAKAPEVESANTVAGAKAEPRPKGRKITTGVGGEGCKVIQEEVYSFAEQLTYCGSNVKRVPGTMEMRDFFLAAHETRNEEEAEAELCYSIVSVPASLPDPSTGEGATDLSEFVDRLLAMNPNFGVITRLKDLDESNFVERKLQRLVGYQRLPECIWGGCACLCLMTLVPLARCSRKNRLSFS